MTTLYSNKIPAELKDFPQWVLWSNESRNDKQTKVPYNVNGTRASVTNPMSWSSFEEALAAYEDALADHQTNPDRYGGECRYSGIGFVLTRDDPFVGVDLDHCVTDGVIEDSAQSIVDRLDSYSEVTPSGEGLRIFIKGSLPQGGRKKGNTEMYESGRFLTVTGQHLEGTPGEINQRQEEIKAIHAEVFGEQQAGRASNHSGAEPLLWRRQGNSRKHLHRWKTTP